MAAKGLSKIIDNEDLKKSTESLVDYSGMLQGKAVDHSFGIAEFIGTVLSYAVTAVIWASAVVITPLIWVP